MHIGAVPLLLISLAFRLGLGLGVGSSDAFAQEWTRTVFPEQIHEFGYVAQGSVLSHRFPIVNSTDQTIRIRDYRLRCGCSNLRLPVRVLPPRTRSYVELTADTSQYGEAWSTGVTLILDRPRSAEVDLKVTCFIRSEILLEPGLVDFGPVSPGDSPERDIDLVYLGNDNDWELSDLVSGSPHLKARMSRPRRPGLGRPIRIRVQLSPDAPVGRLRERISLVTTSEIAPRIPLTVHAEIRPRFRIAPSILKIGPIAPGDRITKALIVRGEEPFRIAEVLDPAEELAFSLPKDPPQTTQRILVRFEAPETIGTWHHRLRFRIDDGSESDPEDGPVAVARIFATVRAEP